MGNDNSLWNTGRMTPALRKLAHNSHDCCSNCGSSLPGGKPAYAGYDPSDKPLYVGECCLGSLREMASFQYWEWTRYKRPAPDAILWRYMDFAKLVALLKDRAVYFARADLLGDHFEGARGIAPRQEEWKNFCLEWYRRSIHAAPRPVGSPQPIPELVEMQAQNLYEQFVQLGARERLSTYISCWHHNTVESEAQWRLYAPPTTSGIAIRTTFGKLDAGLDDAYEIKGGHVQYIDFTKAFAGTYDRVFWKRSSLSHEAEVRLVINQTIFPAAFSGEATATGVSVKLPLERAIEAIVVSPFSPPWLEEVVRETINRFGVSLPVERSSLLAQPFF